MNSYISPLSFLDNRYTLTQTLLLSQSYDSILSSLASFHLLSFQTHESTYKIFLIPTFLLLSPILLVSLLHPKFSTLLLPFFTSIVLFFSLFFPFLPFFLFFLFLLFSFPFFFSLFLQFWLFLL